MAQISKRYKVRKIDKLIKKDNNLYINHGKSTHCQYWNVR